MYKEDYDGKVPPDLDTLDDYSEIINSEMLNCPGMMLGMLNEEDLNPYVYRGGDLSGEVPGNMILMHDSYGNHPEDNRNVLFADGHVQKCTEDEFEQLIERDNELRKERGLAEKPGDTASCVSSSRANGEHKETTKREGR